MFKLFSFYWQVKTARCRAVSSSKDRLIQLNKPSISITDIYINYIYCCKSLCIRNSRIDMLKISVFSTRMCFLMYFLSTPFDYTSICLYIQCILAMVSLCLLVYIIFQSRRFGTVKLLFHPLEYSLGKLLTLPLIKIIQLFY